MPWICPWACSHVSEDSRWKVDPAGEQETCPTDCGRLLRSGHRARGRRNREPQHACCGDAVGPLCGWMHANFSDSGVAWSGAVGGHRARLRGQVFERHEGQSASGARWSGAAGLGPSVWFERKWGSCGLFKPVWICALLGSEVGSSCWPGAWAMEEGGAFPRVCRVSRVEQDAWLHWGYSNPCVYRCLF